MYKFNFEVIGDGANREEAEKQARDIVSRGTIPPKSSEPVGISQRDYQEAIVMQNSVNLVAITRSFHDVLQKMLFIPLSTEQIWKHPITIMYANKILSLTACDNSDLFSHAYAECRKLGNCDRHGRKLREGNADGG